jgi:hypothetical protein
MSRVLRFDSKGEPFLGDPPTNVCVYCEGVADFHWLDGGWYVCTGCVKEGKTDTEAIEEGESE